MQVFLATVGDRDEEKLVNDLGVQPANLEQARATLMLPSSFLGYGMILILNLISVRKAS